MSRLSTSDQTRTARRGWWWSPRLQDGHFLALVWLLGRVLLFTEWAVMRFSLGDTRYYYEKISQLGDLGPRVTMPEYPTPVVWLLKVPDLVSFGHRWAYVLAFYLMMFLLDAFFTRSLWRRGGPLRGQAVAFWSLFVPLVGITAYLRYDIVTAVLAGWALLALRGRRPGAAGALVALGAALKLWPALLWPALLGGQPDGSRRTTRLRATAGFLGAGALLALASLAWAGWDRLVSPLGWQSERGLQIESVWASIPMLARLVRPHSYWVAVSEFNAWEISGPATHLLLRLASASTALGMLFALACYLLWLRRDRQQLVDAAALMLLVILVMIVTNKTFSPQYIIWVGGPLAAGWAIAEDPTRGDAHTVAASRHLARTSGLTLLLTALTQLVYPIGYASLVGHRPGMVPATLVLLARNLVLCWVLVAVCQWVWSILAGRSIAGVPDHSPHP